MIIIISNVDFQKEMVDNTAKLIRDTKTKKVPPENCRTVEEDNNLYFHCLIPNITMITNLYT